VSSILTNYVYRCIKPNAEKSNKIDRNYLLHQLKCCGIIEAIRIRKNGYSHRFTFLQFYNRYRVLVGGDRRGKEFCEWLLMKIAKGNQSVYQLGLSKVFLKEEQVTLQDLFV
jgi:myosin heavy subunit